MKELKELKKLVDKLQEKIIKLEEKLNKPKKPKVKATPLRITRDTGYRS